MAVPLRGVRLGIIREYWFTDFFLSLGATIDLQVFGYGAWHGTKDFLTLDLSSITGSADLKIGPHQQCDWAFNCAQVGPAGRGTGLR